MSLIGNEYSSRSVSRPELRLLLRAEGKRSREEKRAVWIGVGGDNEQEVGNSLVVRTG